MNEVSWPDIPTNSHHQFGYILVINGDFPVELWSRGSTLRNIPVQRYDVILLLTTKEPTMSQ